MYIYMFLGGMFTGISSLCCLMLCSMYRRGKEISNDLKETFSEKLYDEYDDL